MEDWERKRTEERITKLETELRELKLEVDRREFQRKLEADDRKFKLGLIPMVAAIVFAFALPLFAIVSRLAARG